MDREGGAAYGCDYKFVDDNAENIVRPDHEIHRTWDDFKRGFDPTLDWALKYRDAQ